MFWNRLLQFLNSRYGNDQLNIFILALAVICAVLNIFLDLVIIYLLQSLCFLLYLLRYFSSNKLSRSKENDKFLNIYSKFSRKNYNFGANSSYYGSGNATKKEAGYKYFKCSGCNAKLRVPKGKGKITITCPKCRTSFKGKS